MTDMDRELIPRCEELDGSSLRIVQAYTDAVYFHEANAITVTDGTRTAVYVPLRPYEERVGDRVRCHLPGSWVDGKEGVIQWLHTQGTDGIAGHCLKMDVGGITIVPPHQLELLKAGDAEPELLTVEQFDRAKAAFDSNPAFASREMD